MHQFSTEELGKQLSPFSFALVERVRRTIWTTNNEETLWTGQKQDCLTTFIDSEVEARAVPLKAIFRTAEQRIQEWWNPIQSFTLGSQRNVNHTEISSLKTFEGEAKGKPENRFWFFAFLPLCRRKWKLNCFFFSPPKLYISFSATSKSRRNMRRAEALYSNEMFLLTHFILFFVKCGVCRSSDRKEIRLAV